MGDFLNQSNGRYTSSKDDGNGNPITSVEVNNKEPIDVTLSNEKVSVEVSNTSSIPVVIRNTIPIKTTVQKGYKEALLAENVDISSGESSVYALDLVDDFGLFNTYGISLLSTQEDELGKVDCEVYAIPKASSLFFPSSESDKNVLFNESTLTKESPICKSISFKSPKISIVVKASGTVDLKGFTLVVWGMD
ncbi:hypothetical protein P9173_09255 [Bacillus safensis]|uniref:hypothetical protein n=1 Tax=Bacillus safensis TaxID=561879 RepID=UPI0022805B8F|nr:hypothetical protein [Bacillus safensis]MCY7542512.1 hypothetical protein [Bacillus safensis]MCY7552387.1 hypothetical protein [Bacillus safensis]MCY7644818.1 hypothetical protein [Bacillus safensis]MCY7655867.1 hypothetical protein [Bacillus safensis]MEC3710341.1 hypothetical protein [Bacillus safensis]